MTRFAAIGLGVVLIASADFELRVEGVPETICAKSGAVCETARAAIRAGWLVDIKPDAATACIAHPGCFPASSDCIQNWNCPVGPRQ